MPPPTCHNTAKALVRPLRRGRAAAAAAATLTATSRPPTGYGCPAVGAHRGQLDRPGHGGRRAAGQHRDPGQRGRDRGVVRGRRGRPARVARRRRRRRRPVIGVGRSARGRGRRAAPGHDARDPGAHAVGRRAPWFRAARLVPGLQRGAAQHHATGTGDRPGDRARRRVVPQPAAGARARQQDHQAHRVLTRHARGSTPMISNKYNDTYPLCVCSATVKHGRLPKPVALVARKLPRDQCSD